MAWVNAPNTYWVAYDLFNGNSFSLNSVYFAINSGVANRPQAHSIAHDMRIWANTHLTPILSSEISVMGASATDMTTETSFTEFELNIGGIPGTQGPMMPMVCGKRIFFETGFIGRSYRGYNTVCGLPKDVCQKDYVLGSFVLSLINAYSYLPGIAAANGCTWVVCSRHTAGADRTVAVNTPITSITYKHLLVDFWEQRKPGAHTTGP